MDFMDVFVTVIIAVALYVPLNSFVEAANVTGILGTLLDLVPLLYVVAIVAAIAYQIKRSK